MSPSDCATYGGLAHYKGDRAAEAEHHRTELVRAAALLTTNFPGLSVEPYFVTFDGIWELRAADDGIHLRTRKAAAGCLVTTRLFPIFHSNSPRHSGFIPATNDLQERAQVKLA